MQEANVNNRQQQNNQNNFLDKIVSNQLDVDTDDLVFQLGQDTVHKLDWDKKKNKLIKHIEMLNNALNSKVKELEENKNSINKINELNHKIKELEKTVEKKDSSIEYITIQVSEERKLKHSALENANKLKEEIQMLKNDRDNDDEKLKEKDNQLAEYADAVLKYKDKIELLEKEIKRRDKISKSRSKKSKE